MSRSMHVVVTGAGSGIGLTTACHFAHLGHSVLAVDLNKAAAETACQTLVSFHISCRLLIQAFRNKYQLKMDPQQRSTHLSSVTLETLMLWLLWAQY